MTIHMANLGNPLGFATVDNLTGLVDTGLADDTYGVFWIFQTDGTCDQNRNTNTDTTKDVFSPVAKGANLWIRCTETAGLTLTSGTAGVWRQLNSSWTFGIERTAIETSYQLTYDLATDSGGSNIISSKLVSGTVGKIV